MKLFIRLLILDCLTKLLALVMAPSNIIFKLHFNDGLAMGIDANIFFKFIAPLFLIPLPWMGRKLIPEQYRELSLSLMYAGMVGNYIGRFYHLGVIDFINLQVFVCNLADVYQWIAIFIFYKYARPNLEKPALK